MSVDHDDGHPVFKQGHTRVKTDWLGHPRVVLVAEVERSHRHACKDLAAAGARSGPGEDETKEREVK